MNLKCQCCGAERTFIDGEAAFLGGWDAPPHFTGYVTCNLCPAVCVVLGKGHVMAHAHWERHGRPVDFNNFCVIDEAWGMTQAALEEQTEGVKAWIDKTKNGETEQ